MQTISNINDDALNPKQMKAMVDNYRKKILFDGFLIHLFKVLNISGVEFINIKKNNVFNKQANFIYTHEKFQIFDSFIIMNKEPSKPLNNKKNEVMSISYYLIANGNSYSELNKKVETQLQKARACLKGPFVELNKQFLETVQKWELNNINITKENYQEFIAEVLQQPERLAYLIKEKLNTNEDNSLSRKNKKNIL